MSSSRLLPHRVRPDIRPHAFLRHYVTQLVRRSLDALSQFRAGALGALGAGGLEPDAELPQVVRAAAKPLRQREAPGHV